MTVNTKRRKESKLGLALLAYNIDGLTSVQKLLADSDMKNQFIVTTWDLKNHSDIKCDIAIVAFNKDDSINDFASDIASLKIIKKIPAVLAVVSDVNETDFSESIGELEIDDIFYLPISIDSFKKNLTTYLVSVKLQKEKKGSTLMFSEHTVQLGQLLVEHNLITPLQLKKALDYQKESDMLLGEVLVLLGYIDEDQKLSILASQLGVGKATSQQFASADLVTVGIIPAHIAKRNSCIALEAKEKILTVAMTDVRDLKLLDHLRDLTDMTINPILGSSEDIKTSIERYYRDISSQKDATNLIADFETDVQYIQDKREDISVEEAVAAGAELGIIKLVNMLIVNAVRDKASDVHIEPMENYLVVRYRIDGDLRRVMSPPRKSHQAIITRIKILANLDIAERRLPHDGRMVVKMGHKEIDIRVSILPTVFGEKAVLRILDKEAFERNISNLGFDESNIEIFRSHITRPYGMIIVTGPTGSGKSTTLYSAIQTIKNVKRNIITVEDPVEYNIDGVSQLHVNTKIGLTFATALRSILRQDPDIILIGEIRDEETADIAVKMALTGHLVFSTLHTNDAAGAVARFVDMNIPPLLLGSSLNLIIAQRLVRKICPKCKIKYNPEQELLEQLRMEGSPDLYFYKGKGCVTCNGTGYSGRIGLFEMIEVSKSIKRLVLKNRSTQKINETAKTEGMKTLRQSGIEKVLQGITTIEQVIAVTSDV